MDPQIIIPALSCSFISDSVRVFQLATKNKFPCLFLEENAPSSLPCSSSSVRFPPRFFLDPPSFVFFPRPRGVALINCGLLFHRGSRSTSLSALIIHYEHTDRPARARWRDAPIHHKRDLETIRAAGGACLCALWVFWSKVTVPRRMVSWQSNHKSREIMREQSL